MYKYNIWVIAYSATAPADDATIGMSLLHKESIMGRSTFEGPILSGDQRFGAQRDVGAALLTQTAFLNFANTTAGTAGYSGASTVFVSPNNIPNNVGTIWTPQAGSYSASGPTVATVPTADASGTIYRGAVFLLPQASNIQNIYFDYLSQPTDGSSNVATVVNVFISNQFVTSSTGAVYGSVATNTTTAIGRTIATYTASQYANVQSTLQDVQNVQPGNQPTWFSQVVVTIQMLGSSLGAPVSGKMGITLQYAQSDTNIGTSSTYPYGNFD